MPPVSPCPDARELEQVLHGQAPPGDVERVARHLEGCGRCADAVDRLLDGEAIVLALRAGPAEVTLAEEEAVRGLAAQLRGLPDGAAAATPWGPHAAMVATPSRTPTGGSADEILRELAPPGAPDEVGRFGPYGILRELGSGGMGMVFAARQQRPRRVVALKMILAGRVGGQRLARFRGETEIVARLQHPNIVPIHEVGEHAGRPYFTMEYADGGSLAQKLAAAPLPPGAAAELTEVLARAVHFAHEQGVVHRDLKPSNVLLTAGGVPKVADFGLAKQLDADPDGITPGYRTESGALLGTPAYMAPEQASGDPKAVGRAADIYALGAILYECLTGRPPFKAAGVLETLEQVRSREPVPPSRLQPGVPRDLQTVCLKCLEKDPARRYASGLDLADDLRRFLEGRPVLARPASPVRRLAKWARRQPVPAALAAACALLLGALVAGALLYQSGLRAAVSRAEAEKAEAHRQQDLAAQNYRQARDTLNRMLARLEGGRLAEVPRLRELQRDLLEDALAFYQAALERQESPEPAVRLDAAVAYRRAADMQQALGQPDAAAENYRRSIALVDGLPAADRDAAESQALVAGCYTNLAVLAGTSGRGDEAERHHRTALAIHERLAQARPDDPGPRNGLAESEHGLGALYQVSGKRDEAVAHYTRAVTIRTALVRDHPGEERYQAALAEDYVNLGLLYQQLSRNAEVSPTYEKAEALLRRLTEGHPAEMRYTLTLVGLDVNWGYFLASVGRSQESLARLDEAVRRAEAAVLQEPRHSGCRQRGVQAHGARADVYEFLGRVADSVKEWDRAVELADGPDRFRWRKVRARVLTEAGDHARAVAEADDLATQPEAVGENLYDLACVYGLAIEPARSDARLRSGERNAVVERYGSRAVAVLQKLQAQGYFKHPAHARQLRNEKALRWLRDRDDFRKLLTDGEGGQGR
jgi:tetratricopeptide (TPR) repeat protein